MDTQIEQEPIESQLQEAEASLTRAVERFRALRRAAFAGRYDPDEFDRAVLACRAAEVQLLATRDALASRPLAPSATAGAEPKTPDPMARLRFARWLVETGRLSEEITT